MATLRITRSSEYANYLRSMKVLIDGQVVGKLENGESRDFEIESGYHFIQAKIDWCASKKVELQITGNETRNFTLNSFANGNILTLFMNKYLQLQEI